MVEQRSALDGKPVSYKDHRQREVSQQKENETLFSSQHESWSIIGKVLGCGIVDNQSVWLGWVAARTFWMFAEAGSKTLALKHFTLFH